VSKLIFKSMSRGIIWVDENLSFLVEPLKQKNFNVKIPPKGTEDSYIINYLIPGKKFITNNSKHFEDDIPVQEYGLICTENVTKDPEKLAQIISKAWIDLELRNKDSFKLTLYNDGKHLLEFKE
jgi:hypothetical protein